MEIMLKGIFVDFDGTLVDSLPALWKCYRLFLSSHGIDGNEEEFISLMGPQIGEIVAALKEKYHLLPSHEDLIGQYREIVAAAYATNVVLFPWAKEVLREQKKLGRRLAVVTAAPAPFVIEVLQRYGIAELFENVFGSHANEPCKPHPAIYRRALREMQIQSDEVVAIEDSPNGLESARHAGITAITFTPTTTEFLPADAQKPLFGWHQVAAELKVYSDG